MNCALIYYSKSGITKEIADRLIEEFTPDVFFIEPEKAYGGYMSAVIRVGREKLSKKTVEVKNEKVDFSDYDVIFLGFPVWYYKMPDFMEDYLQSCTFGKSKIYPFITAGSRGLEGSLESIKNICPDCEIKQHLFTTNVNDEEIAVWIDSIK